MPLNHTLGRRRRARRTVIAMTLGVVMSLVAAGCGGGGGGGSSGGSQAADPLVKVGQKQIAEAEKPLKFTPPGPPVDAAKARERTVLVLSVDQRVPTLAAAATAMKQAGAVAGLKVDVFDAQADVSRMQQGVTQAINQKVGAMILLGIPTELVRSKLGTTKIPAIAVLNNDPRPDEPGQGAGRNVYATSAPPYTKAGQLLAYKAIVDRDGKANVVIFNSTGIDPAAPTVQGIKSVLDRCTGCKSRMNDTPLADWSTKLPGLAQSEIRRDPNVNYLLPIFDGMGLFAATGVRQAGAAERVKLAAFNGVPAALALVQKGDVFAADPGQSNEWIGWHAIDQSLRGMLGMKPADPEVPLRFFDTKSLQGVDVKDEGALYGTAFRAGYRKLWGVGGG